MGTVREIFLAVSKKHNEIFFTRKGAKYFFLKVLNESNSDFYFVTNNVFLLMENEIIDAINTATERGINIRIVLFAKPAIVEELPYLLRRITEFMQPDHEKASESNLVFPEIIANEEDIYIKEDLGSRFRKTLKNGESNSEKILNSFCKKATHAALQ